MMLGLLIRSMYLGSTCRIVAMSLFARLRIKLRGKEDRGSGSVRLSTLLKPTALRSSSTLRGG
jgi:hypothetical protein